MNRVILVLFALLTLVTSQVNSQVSVQHCESVAVGSPGSFGPVYVTATLDNWQIEGDGTFTNDDTSGGGTDHDVSFGNWNGVEWAAFRFALPSAIHSGATITSATLDVWTYNSGYNHGYVYVTASADAPQVSSGAGAPSVVGGSTTVWPSTLQTATVNTVRVDGANGSGAFQWHAYMTPPIDIAVLIQHLVDTYGGLASGAHIVLWIGGGTDGGTYNTGDATATDGNFSSVDLADYAYDGTTPGTAPARISIAWN